MSGHADTIRERVDNAEADGWYGYDAEARTDVRWLLAENQRLEIEAKWNHQRVHELEDSLADGRAENQRLREALERITAMLKASNQIAREALAGDAE